MSAHKIVKFVLAAIAGSLMLGAASAQSFGPPGRFHPGPMCDASCQANKAKPPVKLQAGKSTGAATNGNKGLRPQ